MHVRKPVMQFNPPRKQKAMGVLSRGVMVAVKGVEPV